MLHNTSMQEGVIMRSRLIGVSMEVMGMIVLVGVVGYVWV